VRISLRGRRRAWLAVPVVLVVAAGSGVWLMTRDSTAADTSAISARPAKRAFAAAMTLPMSAAPLAPVSATRAATSAAIASTPRRAGR